MKSTAAYLFTLALAALILPTLAWAHCDTLGGPVIADARLALDTGDLAPVLKWVKPENEVEVQLAFQKTMNVRSKGTDAREIADRYFFETLVRLHRKGENAPFTGLKDEPVERPIALAEEALRSGSDDELANEVLAQILGGLRQRFTAVSEARKHANDSVSSGRKYVARYVEFMHYIERLDALGRGETHAESAAAQSPGE
jgi:hypothetical protein